MKEFYSGTRIIAGSGAVQELKNLGIQRLFLVTDPFFAENGVAQRIAAASQAQVVEIFRDV